MSMTDSQRDAVAASRQARLFRQELRRLASTPDPDEVGREVERTVLDTLDDAGRGSVDLEKLASRVTSFSDLSDALKKLEATHRVVVKNDNGRVTVTRAG